MEINWKKAEELSEKSGPKKSEKPLVMLRKRSFGISAKAIELIGLKVGDALLFGESEGRWFIKRNSSGFKLKSNGKSASLKFYCRVLKEQLLTFYNAQKEKTVATGYTPSEACSFLVVEVEEIQEARVFELLPIL